MKTQVEKKLPAKQESMEETEKLIKLASESLARRKRHVRFYGHEIRGSTKEIFKK